jgi:hypothetical protein
MGAESYRIVAEEINLERMGSICRSFEPTKKIDKAPRVGSFLWPKASRFALAHIVINRQSP